CGFGSGSRAVRRPSSLLRGCGMTRWSRGSRKRACRSGSTGPTGIDGNEGGSRGGAESLVGSCRRPLRLSASQRERGVRREGKLIHSSASVEVVVEHVAAIVGVHDSELAGEGTSAEVEVAAHRE